MLKLFLLLAALFAVAPLHAWDWFGLVPDEDDTNTPTRIHRLLEPANDFIELAEDEALKGNADKAIENYRKAIGELKRIQRENPDRAGKPEFTPVRNKEAACNAAIDAIRFAQVENNVNAVAVTDVTELRKKYNRKHGLPVPEDAKKPEPAKKPEAAKPPEPAKKPEAAKPPEPAKEPEAEKKPEPAKEPEAEKKPEATKRPAAVQPAATGEWGAAFAEAKAKVRAGDYATADRILDRLVKERPNDLNALLLRAAAQAGTGSLYAARRTLEKANRAHPKSYLPYYNLAGVSLQLGEGAEAAWQYYELGRAVGGPVDARIEKLCKPKERK